MRLHSFVFRALHFLAFSPLSTPEVAFRIKYLPRASQTPKSWTIFLVFFAGRLGDRGIRYVHLQWVQYHPQPRHTPSSFF